MIALKNGKRGLINIKGEVIIPLEYEDIKDISNNYIIVKKNNKWGAINFQNKIVIPFEYTFLNPYYEGLFLASKDDNKKIGYINNTNNYIINPTLDFCWYGNFSEGLAVVKRDNKYGYIDKNGTQIIPFKFQEAYPFISGIALVQSIETKKYFFIDKNGNRVLNNEEYKILFPSKDGFSRYAN